MKRLAFVLALTMAAPVLGDILYLKDGTSLQGDVKKGSNGYVVNVGGGQVKVVPFEQVKTIELATAPKPSADNAREKLLSLRRSVDYVDDIDKIIERYERAVEQLLGTPAAEEAAQDLQTWRQRRDAGLVKYGTKWVTPAERATMREQAIRQASEARRLLRAGRLAEAETVINQALQQDPQNVSALYLRGLLQVRQEQLLPARKSFEQVNALVPNHGPTLNNLAVVTSRTNQSPQSLNFYDQAMVSAPGDRQILNNVAEALHALPEDQRGGQIPQRVARKFTEQDTDLQRELAKQGLHRWGANWVTTEQLGQLKEAERQVKDKLDALAADFDATKVRITNIDRNIEETERAMRRVEASSYVWGPGGVPYQAVLPQSYYELQADIRNLQAERQQQFARLDRLREQAKAVNQELPVPKYAGIQRIIDVEGTPVIAPDAGATTTAPATTQPASPAPATQPVQ